MRRRQAHFTLAVVLATAVLAGGGCGEDGDALFTRADLESIVTARDAPAGTALVGIADLAPSEVAADLGVTGDTLGQAEFLAARSAGFTGPEEGMVDPDYSSEMAIVFADADGARFFLDERMGYWHTKADKGEVRMLEPLGLGDASFGAAVLDIHTPTSSEYVHGWYWRTGNLVLVAAAPPGQAEAFAHALDRRAVEAR